MKRLLAVAAVFLVASLSFWGAHQRQALSPVPMIQRVRPPVCTVPTSYEPLTAVDSAFGWTAATVERPPSWTSQTPSLAALSSTCHTALLQPRLRDARLPQRA